MGAVAEALRAQGYKAHIQGKDTFGTGTLDVDWLPKVGEKGWILVTKDKNIRRREVEQRALHESRVRTFVITAAGLRGEEQAQLVIAALPEMLRILRRRSSHFIARITAAPTVEIIEFRQ